jgi:hypothetical protein
MTFGLKIVARLVRNRLGEQAIGLAGLSRHSMSRQPCVHALQEDTRFHDNLSGKTQ